MSSTAPPRRRGSIPLSLRLLLIGGFVLGAAATVLVVVFADEARWLRIAVLLALWAALFAAFAVARSRREAQQVAAREDEITRTYQLQLQREVAARREYEAGLNERIREEVTEQQAQELASLRAQLTRLTDTLSQFIDGDLLVERLTLSAEATRLKGIPGGRLGARLGELTRGELGSVVQDAVGQSAESVTASGAAARRAGAGTDISTGDSAAVDLDAIDAIDAIDAEVVEEPADTVTVTDRTVAASPESTGSTEVLDDAELTESADARLASRPEAPAAAWARRHRNDVRHQTAQVAATRAERARQQAERAEAERIAAERAARERIAADRAARIEAAQHEASQRDAAQREAAQRDAAQRLAARRDAAQREAAQREAAQREAAHREAAQREAAQRDAAQREAAQREAAHREAAQRDAAGREGADRAASPADSTSGRSGAGPATFRPIGAFSIAARGPLDPGGPAAAAPADAAVARQRAPIPTQQATPPPRNGSADAAPPAQDENHHGGHEIDESSDSGRVSVADLLAAFGSQGSPQRRRRRAAESDETA